MMLMMWQRIAPFLLFVQADPQAASLAEAEARFARALARLAPAVDLRGREPLRWQLEERMAFYRVPGVSLAVIEDGRVAFAHAYGLAEAGSDRRVGPDTLFQAASLSKPVAAVAALRLVDQDRLALDEDVNEYARTWRVPESEFTAEAKVTLRHLLNHTAGFDVGAVGSYREGESGRFVRLVAHLGGTDLEAERVE